MNITGKSTLLACAITAVLFVPNLHAKSFVTEATRVVDNVTDQGQHANTAIESFYQDFSQAAAEMVDLEARVEQWKAEGDLCAQYEQCPDKYELIYAQYGKSMSQIQSAFEKHRDDILESISRFNRGVYQGKDKLSDLRSDDLAALPAELDRLRGDQANLKTRKAKLSSECPDQSSRQCARKWRAFNRSVSQTYQKLQRLAYTRKLSQLRESMVTKLDTVLDRFGDLEADAVATLADYAFMFEQYGELAGTQGIGQLMTTVKQLEDLEKKVSQMKDFGLGMKNHVLDAGNLMNERLAQISGHDMSVSSRSEMVSDNARLLESNENLLRELEKELGPQTSL